MGTDGAERKGTGAEGLSERGRARWAGARQSRAGQGQCGSACAGGEEFADEGCIKGPGAEFADPTLREMVRAPVTQAQKHAAESAGASLGRPRRRGSGACLECALHFSSTRTLRSRCGCTTRNRKWRHVRSRSRYVAARSKPEARRMRGPAEQDQLRGTQSASHLPSRWTCSSHLGSFKAVAYASSQSRLPNPCPSISQADFFVLAGRSGGTHSCAIAGLARLRRNCETGLRARAPPMPLGAGRRCPTGVVSQQGPQLLRRRALAVSPSPRRPPPPASLRNAATPPHLI